MNGGALAGITLFLSAPLMTCSWRSCLTLRFGTRTCQTGSQPLSNLVAQLASEGLEHRVEGWRRGHFHRYSLLALLMISVKQAVTSSRPGPKP